MSHLLGGFPAGQSSTLLMQRLGSDELQLGSRRAPLKAGKLRKAQRPPRSFLQVTGELPSDKGTAAEREHLSPLGTEGSA